MNSEENSKLNYNSYYTLQKEIIENCKNIVSILIYFLKVNTKYHILCSLKKLNLKKGIQTFTHYS